MRLVSKIAALALAATPSLLFAQTPNRLDVVFEGTVTRTYDDSVTVRNPDGSSTTFTRDQLPEYLFKVGDPFRMTIRLTDQAGALGNAACAGRFSIGTAGSSGGACMLEAEGIETPFGTAAFGGTGGDARPFLNGLSLTSRADGNGYDVKVAEGGYRFGYVGVNPIYYDSATKTLSGPTRNRCVDAFNCLDGVGSGTASELSFDIKIAGDFGKVRPGFNVGYLAGLAGRLGITGLFGTVGGSGGGGPTQVPAPGMLLLTGVAAAALMRRRKRALAG